MIINIILIAIIAFIIVVDQVSKLLTSHLMELGDSVEIIEGFFRLKYITNPGMSFSLFDEEGQRWVFMIISPIALVAIGIYLFKFSKDKLPMKIGLAFIFGGGFSNMIDRIFYGEALFKGEVIDMFDFYGIWNAIFNVADSFVCVGAALTICTLLYDIITSKSNDKKKTAEASNPTSENKPTEPSNDMTSEGEK
ncbi:MAG: signal peptidase II [Clostridia bacterium]|nr:signal peptidase II [Clostridia bacterium]